MKAGKTILIVIGLLLAAVGVTTWLLVNNLDRIARETIVETGRELLGTGVSLDAVEITLAEGRAVLAGLVIANPPGFPAGPAMTLETIEVDIDLASIGGEVLVIEKILVGDPRVNYQMNESGDSNIGALQSHVESAAPSSGGDGNRMIIDLLDFRGGGISATAALKPDRKLEFGFPDVSMQGLGRPGGATADEIGAEIGSVLMDRIIAAATRAGVDSLLEQQKEKLIEKAEEKIGEKLKDILKRN